MKIKLTHDTLVRFPSGTVLTVSDAEGRRLIAFNNAVEEKETVSKKTSKTAK